MTDITPRAALADAIDRHEESLIALSDARSTLQKAREFEQQLKDELAKFADLDSKIATSRADALKEALQAGSVPSFGQSPELREALAAKVEIENQIAAAKQAINALEQEVAYAAKVESEARAAVERAAVAVEDEVTDQLLEQLSDLEAKSYALRLRLKSRVHTAPANGGKTAATTRADIHLSTPTKAERMMVMNTPEFNEFKAACMTWRSYHAALLSDPEAAFGGAA